jgi:hypothetical protein
MTAYEEPPVVELEELLGDQEDQPRARPAGQVVLVIALSVIGLVALSVLAVLLIPPVSDFVRWIAVAVRTANGG